VFWLMLYNNKPLETWLFIPIPEIISVDLAHIRKLQVGYFFEDSFFQN
jgi:hypothetical protein